MNLVPFVNPKSDSEKLSSIQAIKEDIEDIVNESLSHISPEAVLDHDPATTCDLLEIVTALIATSKPYKPKQTAHVVEAAKDNLSSVDLRKFAAIAFLLSVVALCISLYF